MVVCVLRAVWVCWVDASCVYNCLCLVVVIVIFVVMILWWLLIVLLLMFMLRDVCQQNSFSTLRFRKKSPAVYFYKPLERGTGVSYNNSLAYSEPRYMWQEFNNFLLCMNMAEVEMYFVNV